MADFVGAVVLHVAFAAAALAAALIAAAATFQADRLEDGSTRGAGRDAAQLPRDRGRRSGTNCRSALGGKEAR